MHIRIDTDFSRDWLSVEEFEKEHDRIGKVLRDLDEAQRQSGSNISYGTSAFSNLGRDWRESFIALAVAKSEGAQAVRLFTDGSDKVPDFSFRISEVPTVVESVEVIQPGYHRHRLFKEGHFRKPKMIDDWMDKSLIVKHAQKTIQTKVSKFRRGYSIDPDGLAIYPSHIRIQYDELSTYDYLDIISGAEDIIRNIWWIRNNESYKIVDDGVISIETIERIPTYWT